MIMKLLENHPISDSWLFGMDQEALWFGQYPADASRYLEIWLLRLLQPYSP